MPPSRGSDPILSSLRKNPLVASLHVAAGDFVKAMELLKKQLAIADFEPLKKLFVDVYTLGKVKLQTLPHTAPLDFHLRTKSAFPLVAVTLPVLQSKYTTGIELTTKGEFSQALDVFRQCL